MGTHCRRSLAVQRPHCGGLGAVLLFPLSPISTKVICKAFDIANGDDNGPTRRLKRSSRMTFAFVRAERLPCWDIV
jgi:hypothetical protein